MYVFGAFLIYAGVHMMFSNEAEAHQRKTGWCSLLERTFG